VAKGSEGRERRQRPRVAVHGEVLSRIQSAAGPVLNISESGALIEVTAHLRPGTVYVVRLPVTLERQLTLRSRVVRSEVHAVQQRAGGEGGVTYHVAVEFVGLTDAERKAIAEHLLRTGPAAADGAELEEDFDR
jgi:hypothetical protein